MLARRPEIWDNLYRASQTELDVKSLSLAIRLFWPSERLFKLTTGVRSYHGSFAMFQVCPAHGTSKVREHDLSEAQSRTDPRSTIRQYCRIIYNFTSLVDRITSITMYCNLIATAQLDSLDAKRGSRVVLEPEVSSWWAPATTHRGSIWG